MSGLLPGGALDTIKCLRIIATNSTWPARGRILRYYIMVVVILAITLLHGTRL